MSDPVKISVYRKNTASDYLETAIDVARWIKKYEVIKGAYKCWEISSGAGSKEGDDLAQKMTDRSIYSGAAGVGLFFIQLYEATENEKYLDEAIQAGEYLLNTFNENNIMILTEQGESLGSLSAELCNVIAPLVDLGYAAIKSAHVSYIERIRDRSRYAKQGVLFIEVHIALYGI